MNTKLKSIKKPQTLDDLLYDIDADTIKTSDLKHLIIQYINDTPDDPTDQKGYRARLRLEGLRLLSEVLKQEGKESSLDSSVLQLLKSSNTDEDSE